MFRHSTTGRPRRAAAFVPSQYLDGTKAALPARYAPPKVPAGVEWADLVVLLPLAGEAGARLKRKSVAPRDEEVVEEFRSRCYYKRGKGYGDLDAFAELNVLLGEHEQTLPELPSHNRLFYLAIPPSAFGDAGVAIKAEDAALTAAEREATGVGSSSLLARESLPSWAWISDSSIPRPSRKSFSCF